MLRNPRMSSGIQLLPMSSPAAQASPSQSHLHPRPAENLGNIEKLHAKGYPSLAYFFSGFPRYVHVRRFGALAARVLLYRQQKLIRLEKDLLENETEGNCHVDFDRLDQMQGDHHHDSPKDPHLIYGVLKRELKEYEEAIIRFGRLGSMKLDTTQLEEVQRILFQKEWCDGSLAGLDNNVWGSLENPSDYAHDLIQVVQHEEPSFIAKFIRNKWIQWTPHLPPQLWRLLFWSKKQPDSKAQLDFNARALEDVILVVGNIAISLILYSAITGMIFVSGKAVNAVTVVLIASSVTACSVMFRNHQFVSMVAAVCAVLVTLLAKNSNGKDC